MCLRGRGRSVCQDDVCQDAGNPEVDEPLPGLPAGFLAYQINYRCVKGCTHCSCGASVDGGGRGQAAGDVEERSDFRSASDRR
jgi:hypothetical protein